MSKSNFRSKNNYRVEYAYTPLYFYIISFLAILFFWRQSKLIATIGLFIDGLFFYYDYLKSFAVIELNENELKLVYHPFFKPEIFLYIIKEIDQVSIYSSWKRYHRTILYVSLKGSTIVHEHTLGIGVSGAKEFYNAFKSLGVPAVELGKPLTL